MADDLTKATRETLDGLLTLDPAVRRSPFAWLRDYAEAPAPSTIIALLDRLDLCAALGSMLTGSGASTPPALAAFSARLPS